MSKMDETGIVLITVLLFLQLFTILGLFALQNGFLAKMTSQAFYQHDKDQRQAEYILSEVEKNGSVSCLTTVTERNDWISKPLDWWKSSAMCAGHKNHYQYYYAIESLGEDPCAYMEGQANKLAHYYRVTVLVLSENQKQKELLQSSIIKMDNMVRECEGKPHPIIPGRQMWRIL